VNKCKPLPSMTSADVAAPAVLLHVPNVAGVRTVIIHEHGELRARVGVAVFGGLARIHCVAFRLLRVTPRLRACQIMLATL